MTTENRDRLRVALLTREYPPEVYGGAGVHVEYLARELSAHVDLTHVRHIKKAGVGASAQVLVDRPGRVLHWHVPAAKFNHAPTQPAMRGVQ